MLAHLASETTKSSATLARWSSGQSSDLPTTLVVAYIAGAARISSALKIKINSFEAVRIVSKN